jgi:hypothetical protein
MIMYCPTTWYVPAGQDWAGGKVRQKCAKQKSGAYHGVLDSSRHATLVTVAHATLRICYCA